MAADTGEGSPSPFYLLQRISLLTIKSITMKFTAIFTNEVGQETTYASQRTTVDVQRPESKRWTLNDVQGKRKPSKPSHSRSLNRSTDLWAAIEKENGSIEWSTCGIHRANRYV